MKKMYAFLACLIILCLTGCKGKQTNQIDLTEIAALPETTLETHLIGTARDTIWESWGEPDESLTTVSADVYNIPDTAKQLILYYDEAGKLADILILDTVADK